MPISRFLPMALRSAAFRFALLLAMVFALGAGILLVAVQRQIGRYAVEASQGMLRAEATVLAGEYAELGLSGLTDAMARHRSVGDDPPYHYLLVDAGGRRRFGDLPAGAARLGWNTLLVEEHVRGNDRQESMSAFGTRLPDGLLLVVATDSFDVQDLRARLGRFTLVSGIGITLFALLGGYLTGRIFLRRLDRVNRAVDRIIDGDRTERLPLIGFGPEFDDLSRNLNRMLDRNAAAMDALHQVSTDIAHDLRTPLTRLHQKLERMREADAADPALVDEAIAQTHGLLTTFHALLRIGTVEGGVGRQRFTDVNLTDLMNRIVGVYAPVAEDAHHVLVADHEDGIAIQGDADLLAQLLTNLIENAIVHTHAGTQIVSRLRSIDGRIVIAICDTGPGIPVAERANVFRRFYRLDASRSTEGAGLGLALVAAIAALHGARITIPETEQCLCIRVEFAAYES